MWTILALLHTKRVCLVATVFCLHDIKMQVSAIMYKKSRKIHILFKTISQTFIASIKS